MALIPSEAVVSVGALEFYSVPATGPQLAAGQEAVLGPISLARGGSDLVIDLGAAAGVGEDYAGGESTRWVVVSDGLVVELAFRKIPHGLIAAATARAIEESLPLHLRLHPA